MARRPETPRPRGPGAEPGPAELAVPPAAGLSRGGSLPVFFSAPALACLHLLPNGKPMEPECREGCGLTSLTRRLVWGVGCGVKVGWRNSASPRPAPSRPSCTQRMLERPQTPSWERLCKCHSPCLKTLEAAPTGQSLTPLASEALHEALFPLSSPSYPQTST